MKKRKKSKKASQEAPKPPQRRGCARCLCRTCICGVSSEGFFVLSRDQVEAWYG